MGLRHCPIETTMMAYDDSRTSVLYVHGIPGGVFPVAVKPCDTMSRIRELIHTERQLYVHHGSFYLARGRKLVDGLTIEEQLIDDESNVWYHIGLRGGADHDPNNTKGSDEQFGKASLHSGAIQWVIRDCENVQIGNHNTIVQSSNDACEDQHPESPTTLPQTDSSYRERKPLGPSEGEVLMILHSIANPKNSPSVKQCTLNELATRFDTEYSGKVKMKFKDFGYGSMKNFLKKHPDWFSLVERGQLIFVHALYQRRNMQMQPSAPQAPLSLVQNSSEICSEEGQISDESQFRDREYEDDGSSISSFERDISPESDDYSNEWKVVRRKKSKRLDSEHKMRRKSCQDESQSSYRNRMRPRNGESYRQSIRHLGRESVPCGTKVSPRGLGSVQPVKLPYVDPSANAIPQQSHLDISVQQKSHISVKAQYVTLNVKQNIDEGMSTKLPGRLTDNVVEGEVDYYLSNDENFSCLLTHCENNYIQYRSKHYMRDQNADFMRDVVSFWNTPHYHTSYIILGVVERSHPPHDLIGLDHRVDDNYYQTLFDANFFSGMPHFQYTQKQIEGKRIGVIIVSNSDILRGNPIYPTKYHQTGLWEVNDLLYRDPRSVIRVARSPDESQKVFSWFHNSSKTESPLTAPIKSDIWDKFLESVDHFEDGRAYCLITGPCSIETASVSVLSNIPWIKVFDIDPDSRESGLFSICEEAIRNKRSLYISNCNDCPKELSDKAIEWCFVKTNSHSEESPTSEREWRKEISVGIEQHCQKLAEFTLRRKPVTVIVLWYSSENLLSCLKILLEKLDERVSALKIVFCFDKVSIKEKAQEILRGYFAYLEVPQESIHDIPFEYMCLKLCEELKDGGQVGRFKLPAMKGEAMIEIEIAPKDAAWLKEFFDVLYLDYDHNLATGCQEEFGQDFLRGGILSWYEVKLHLFDVEREIFSKLKNLIHDNIRKGRSAVVSLYHAPGSGGTTVGRRMLWDIHLERKCSCVYVNSKSPEFLAEVEQRISWLHDKTYLPVFVLIDSFVYKDSVGVARLFNVCSREVPVVILYVQRYIGRITKCFQGNKAWLQGEVSYDEAIRLESVFSTSCQPDAKQGLKELMLNVTQKQSNHCMYEFGLTAYDYAFRGTQSYVSGYLDINPSKELTSWQRVIGYLSLVYYYGQMHIPGQFFCNVLNVNEKAVVKLPYEATKFVCETDEGWRINLHAVAKEILEDILCPHQHKRESTVSLSLEAKKGLEKFACEFIEEAGLRHDKSHAISPEIMEIIRSTFFYRNNRETDLGGRISHFKRSTYSQIIMDIVSEPPYTERLNVLSLLSQKFPKDSSALAHLGRFHANEREDFQRAKELMDEAIKIRHEELRRSHCRTGGNVDLVDNSDEILKDVQLTRIYDMLGLVHHRQLSKLIGRLGTKCHVQRDKGNLLDLINESVHLTKMACDAFQKCREYTKEGYEEEISYVHEIEVRLQILEFIENNFEGGYQHFVTHSSADTFVEESLSIIDMLLRECYDKVNILSDQFFKCRNWYYVLFDDVNLALSVWYDTGSIKGRRGKIAAYRMKYNKSAQVQTLSRESIYMDNISELADLEDVISLYEESMRDVFERGVIVKKIDEDMKEWLCTIRNKLVPRVYSVEEVLKQVRQWYDRFKSPYAIYYSYILLTILALGSKGQSGSRECLAESLRFKGHLERAKRFVGRPRRPREWLGAETRTGICRIVYESELGEWDHDSRFWKQRQKLHSLLSRQTGTIRKCHRDVVGEIDMDIGKLKGVETIKCFFVPKANGLHGRRFENRRVEFFVGFNFANGCNAYDVMELNKYQCGKCPQQVEISSIGNATVYCKCGSPVRRKLPTEYR